MSLTAHVDAELRRAAMASVADREAAWRALERAHVLSQPLAWPHVRVHWHMLRFAVRNAELGE
ncbi:MAG: DUF3703 domain-containing protein, partial [Myxococcales bacterium]